MARGRMRAEATATLTNFTPMTTDWVPLAQEAEAAHLGLAGDGWMVGKREGKGKALAFGHALQAGGCAIASLSQRRTETSR